MNAQQALEYSMQPFIPMFIYGDYDAMESERQRGEEAMKALLDEWRTNEEPGFDFGVILTLGRSEPRAVRSDRRGTPAQPLEPAARAQPLGMPTCAPASARCRAVPPAPSLARSAATGDAYSVAYVRKPIKGTVLGIDIETTGRAPERGYIINVGWGDHGAHQ